MTFEEAKELLGRAQRLENRDHAFGDREVYWVLDGVDIADGYFGAGMGHVTIDGDNGASFKGNFAYELAKCGTSVTIGRNDETGPERYQGA